MAKFKKGDKVKILRKPWNSKVKVGSVRTVSQQHYQYYRLSGLGAWFHSRMLERAPLPCTCGERVCNNCRQYRRN